MIEINDGKKYCFSCKKETEEFYDLDISKNRVRLVKIQLFSLRLMPLLIYLIGSIIPLGFWTDLLAIKEYANETIMQFILTLFMTYIFWIRVNFPFLLQKYVENVYNDIKE